MKCFLIFQSFDSSILYASIFCLCVLWNSFLLGLELHANRFFSKNFKDAIPLFYLFGFQYEFSSSCFCSFVHLYFPWPLLSFTILSSNCGVHGPKCGTGGGKHLTARVSGRLLWSVLNKTGPFYLQTCSRCDCLCKIYTRSSQSTFQHGWRGKESQCSHL